jgi:hypothetical protein
MLDPTVLSSFSWPAAGNAIALKKAFWTIYLPSPSSAISTNYNNLDRAYGMSVRCIKSKPDTDTTGEYQAVVSGTLLRNVWLDRNLGEKRPLPLSLLIKTT